MNVGVASNFSPRAIVGTTAISLVRMNYTASGSLAIGKSFAAALTYWPFRSRSDPGRLTSTPGTRDRVNDYLRL